MSGRPGRRSLLLVVSAAVVLAVVAGFLALGTPQDERRRRLDEVRVDDLRALSSAVAAHFDRTGALPATLAALHLPARKPDALADPAGRGPYGYAALDDSSFELCATFDEESRVDPARFAYDPWFHGAGPECFRFRIGRDVAPGQRRELVPLREAAPSAPR